MESNNGSSRSVVILGVCLGAVVLFLVLFSVLAALFGWWAHLFDFLHGA